MMILQELLSQKKWQWTQRFARQVDQVVYCRIRLKMYVRKLQLLNKKRLDLEDGVNSIVGEHRPGDGDSLAATIHPMLNNEFEDMRPKGVACEQKEPGLEDLSSGDIDCSRSQLDESISATGKHQTGDAVPQNSDVFTEQNKEVFIVLAMTSSGIAAKGWRSRCNYA